MQELIECRICKTPNLVKFISFGKMPVANAFLKKEDLGKEEFMYDMEVGFCTNCKMVQMINLVPYDKYIVPDKEGKTNYAFFSSTSKFMEEHFAEVAKDIESRFLNPGDKIIDIGGNDGIMLKAIDQNKNPVINVEPSHNVADIAISLSIPTIKDFFTEKLAQSILKEHGQFKAIFSANVFLNIIDIHSCLEGIRILLEDKGVFITEDPYMLDILDKNSYDQIYDEHVWYFSLASLSNLLEMHGMEIFDAERQWTHGGSMRVYMCKKGAYEKTKRLSEYLQLEKQRSIDSIEPYLDFAKKTEENKNQLIELISNLKSQGKKIVGYAAASKGTIVLNYCKFGPEIIEYISDSTPFKQGLYSPGKHIPVVNPDVFHQDTNVDYALLGAWNHAEEIIKKEHDFIARGGKFIVHLPTPRVIDKIETRKSVEIKELKIFANDQGYLFETVRADDKIFDGNFGQVLVSVIYPGIIKGMHLHEKQTDYTTCISGNIKYIYAKELPDGKIEIKFFIIGEKNPVLIKTPPGFWHGYMPLGGEKATVLHLMDKTFDPKNDDTLRKDPYAFGDIWSVKHG